MDISLVGAGYWGSKLQKELQTIPGVNQIEIIDVKDGKSFDDVLQRISVSVNILKKYLNLR